LRCFLLASKGGKTTKAASTERIVAERLEGVDPRIRPAAEGGIRAEFGRDLGVAQRFAHAAPEVGLMRVADTSVS
jgi:hypothetical protein